MTEETVELHIPPNTTEQLAAIRMALSMTVCLLAETHPGLPDRLQAMLDSLAEEAADPIVADTLRTILMRPVPS